MVGTVRISNSDNEHAFRRQQKAAAGCAAQPRPSPPWNGNSDSTSMDVTRSLEDQTHPTGRMNSSSDSFRPWSLDAFLAQSVESLLFPPDRKSIHEAVEAGDVICVEAFLDSGIELDERRGDGLTPLLIAARCGHQLVCETLLHRGASLNDTTHLSSSPLHEAATYGRAACCQLFLAAGGDPNVKDTDGQSPLHRAAAGGHVAAVRVLLEAGACHSLTAANEETPLHLAVDRGHQAVCRILLQHGATPSVGDQNMVTPLHICAEKGTAAIAQILLESGATLTAQDDRRSTPLMVAAEAGNLAVIHMIFEAARISRYGNVKHLLEQVDESLHTALHLACCAGRLDIVDLFLSRGANFRCRSIIGRTPLHFAVCVNNPEVVALLLRYGAWQEEKDTSCKSTVLHLAVCSQSVEVLRLLLDYPLCTAALVNAQDMYGRTAVHMAALQGKNECIDLLVCHGAFLSAIDSSLLQEPHGFSVRWCMSAHSKFPYHFKAAVRTLLLVAAADSKSLKPCELGRLPREVLLLIIESMLPPPRVWMRAGRSRAE